MDLQEQTYRIKNLINILTENIDFDSISFFKTDQGSKYIRLPDGRLRRWKSYHSNTDGEDKGLHSWSTQSFFVDPQFYHEAYSINDLYEKGFKIAISKDAEGKMFPMIVDSNNWRPATWKDAYPTFVKQKPEISDKVLTWKYIKEPKINYYVIDFDFKEGQGTILKNFHFGSQVSEVGKLSYEDKKLFFPSYFK